MLGKLIEQSEAGKCLVIGTIMADRLIIKQQKLSAFACQLNMVKQGSLALRCMAAFFICKYYILLTITIKNGMICMNNHTLEDWIWTLKMENMLGW